MPQTSYWGLIPARLVEWWMDVDGLIVVGCATFSHGLTYPEKARLPTRWKRHHWSQYASREFQQAIRSHKWFFLARSQVSASCWSLKGSNNPQPTSILRNEQIFNAGTLIVSCASTIFYLLVSQREPTAASHLANKLEVQSDPGGTARILDLSTACHRICPSSAVAERASADEALHPASSKMFRTRSLAFATLPGWR